MTVQSVHFSSLHTDQGAEPCLTPSSSLPSAPPSARRRARSPTPAPTTCSRCVLQVARRARQGRSQADRGRHHRLRHADRRAGLQHRAHRGAHGRLPHRDHRHHRQPPVRLVAAGVPLRRAGGHVGPAGRGRRRRRRVDDAHPDGLGRGDGHARRGAGDSVLADVQREVHLRAAAPVGRDGRREVGHLAPGLRGVRRSRATSAPPPRARAAASATRSWRSRSRAPTAPRPPSPTTRAFAPTRRWRSSPTSSRGQAGRRGHRRHLVADLRRRGGAAGDDAGEGQAARAEAARAHQDDDASPASIRP